MDYIFLRAHSFQISNPWFLSHLYLNSLIEYFMGCQCVAAVSAVYTMGKVRGFSICSIRQLVGPGDFMSPRFSSAAREPVHTGPWQWNFVDARFFSSTCFWPSGAAQQQSGFWISTSGSVWKWRFQWRSSGSPIERSVAHGTLISAPRSS